MTKKEAKVGMMCKSSTNPDADGTYKILRKHLLTCDIHFYKKGKYPEYVYKNVRYFVLEPIKTN